MAGRFKSSYVVIEAAKMSPSRIKNTIPVRVFDPKERGYSRVKNQ